MVVIRFVMEMIFRCSPTINSRPILERIKTLSTSGRGRYHRFRLRTKKNK